VNDTDDGNSLRVALYLRVSTDEQAKSGYSIADQRRTLREHAASKGYAVIEEIEDDGYSGASPDRPGIRRVYELAEAGEIDTVLATKRDRFFRSRLYMLTTVQDLGAYGVTLVSLADTGNMVGDFVMDSFAEYEHQVIRERTVNGKLQKARAAGRTRRSGSPTPSRRWGRRGRRGA
jgi:site-specific DNA recombinase